MSSFDQMVYFSPAQQISHICRLEPGCFHSSIYTLCPKSEFQRESCFEVCSKKIFTLTGKDLNVVWEFVKREVSHADLKFVTTVTTGGRVKIFPTVYIFPENNAFPCKICV